MFRIPALALISCAAVATSSAQQPTQPAFRVGSELVVVDLVATDRAGTNVADLQPSGIFATVAATTKRPNRNSRGRTSRALREPWSFPYEGFDVKARVEHGKLWVTTFIPPTAIRFSDDGGAKKADFSVHGTLRDEKGTLVGGKPAIGRDVGVKLNADRVAELLASGSRLEIRTDVDPRKPGKYQVVTVARDSSGWLAARTVDVTVAK